MRSRPLFRLCLLVLFVAGVPVLAHAAPITYTISQNFSTFSVNGTITTDGTLGVLTTSNVVDFSLTVIQGSSSVVFTQGDSVFHVDAANDFTATLGGLFYDFGNTDESGDVQIKADAGSAAFPDNGAFDSFCLQGLHHNCDTSSTNVEAIAIGGSGTRIPTAEQSMSGVVEISVATATAVPEPESLILTSTGAFGVACAIWQRRKRYLS